MYELKCQICGFESLNLTKHLKRVHNISGNEYKEKYPGNRICFSGRCIEPLLRKGYNEKEANEILKKRNENAIITNKNKENKNIVSCWAKKYWINKGFTEEEAIKKVQEIQSKNSKKRIVHISTWAKKYWINKGFTEEEAKQKVYTIQSKNSSKSIKYRNKKSTPERNRKISISMSVHIKNVGKDIWHSHFGNSYKYINISKIEIAVYNELVQQYSPNMLIQSNKRLLLENKVYIPDIIIGSNIIIEVFGDYWHANPVVFTEHEVLNFPNESIIVKDLWEKDFKRIELFKQFGYKVLVLWEYDLTHNFTETIKIATNFIDENIQKNINRDSKDKVFI